MGRTSAIGRAILQSNCATGALHASASVPRNALKLILACFLVVGKSNHGRSHDDPRFTDLIRQIGFPSE